LLDNSDSESIEEQSKSGSEEIGEDRCSDLEIIEEEESFSEEEVK
jgi:hypothetical protein